MLEPQLFCTQVGGMDNPSYLFKTATRGFHDILQEMMVIQGREKYRNAVICLSIYDTVFMFQLGGDRRAASLSDQKEILQVKVARGFTCARSCLSWRSSILQVSCFVRALYSDASCLFRPHVWNVRQEKNGRPRLSVSPAGCLEGLGYSVLGFAVLQLDLLHLAPGDGVGVLGVDVVLHEILEAGLPAGRTCCQLLVFSIVHCVRCLKKKK